MIDPLIASSSAKPLKGMRIGIDGFNLAIPHGTGVATYARALSKTVAAAGAQVDILYGLGMDQTTDPRARESLFFDALEHENFPRRPKAPSPRWFAETLRHFRGHRPFEIPIKGTVEIRPVAERLPYFDRLFNVNSLFRAASGFFRTTGKFLKVRNPGGVEIMHWTYPLPIEMMDARNVYTVHDIVPLSLPYVTLDNKKLYYRLLATLAARADGIATVSEASLKELVKLFPEASSKCANLYQAVDRDNFTHNSSPIAVNRDIATLCGLQPESYFIYYGALEPKKNIGRLIEAFLQSNCKARLVIVGSRNWKAEGELRFLERGIELGRILKLDYLPADLLAQLVRQAKALVFPSISEGFGLPVVEAMVLGTPVLTSSEGALDEVAGDAALKVNPYDLEAITQGLERLDDDEDLRVQLRRAGLQRAETFSQELYSERLAEFYQKVLKKKHS